MISRNRDNIRQVLLTDELRVDELSKYLHITRQTVHRWLKTGKLIGRSIEDVLNSICRDEATYPIRGDIDG